MLDLVEVKNNLLANSRCIGKCANACVIFKYWIIKRNFLLSPEEESLELNGFAIFSSSASISDTAEVASKIGIVGRIPGMPLVQALTPRSPYNEEKSNYSGNFGTNEFPLHSDLAHWHIPPRYFLLRCVRPSVEVTTNFIKASKLFDSEDCTSLRRGLFRPRRRLDGRLTYLRLWQDEIYRWDTLFLRAINKPGRDLQDRIRNRIASAKQHKIALENIGDCILVDNWKVLHGRSHVPNSSMGRKLERVYLSSIKV